MGESVKYLSLIVYFFILFLIGWWASKKIKNASDFFAGGKSLGYWVVAFSARASGESAWLLLGLTGMGAIYGMQAMWVVLGEVLGVGIAWFFMAKKFKRLTDEYRSITIPDFLSSHFKTNSKLIRIVSSFTLSIFVIIFVSAQIDATGKAFEAFLGWQYYLGIFIGFLIVVVYITSGGFIAVAWSDLFQGLVMMIGLVALPIVAYFAWSQETGIGETLSQMDPAMLHVRGDGNISKNIWTYIGFGMIGLGFLGSPQIFVRFISIKDNKEIKKGKYVAVVYTILTDAAAVFIGMAGRAYFTDAGIDPEEVLGVKAENVLPMLVENIMPMLVIGFYIAAVLSAIMSTIDSLLVVASSAVARDFYQKILNPSLPDDKMTKISRMATIIMAAIALGLALLVSVISPTRNIFWFSIFGWSGIAATFCPMIILILSWKRYTSYGAIASMITGFASVGLCKFYFAGLDSIGYYFNEMGELFPSFVISIFFGVIVSFVHKSSIQKVETS